MRYTRYTRYVPGAADEVNLQALLDSLTDYLLQSGFAGGENWWGEPEADRSIDGLKDAITRALMESGQLTPDMLRLLRGESTGDEARDAELERQLAELLDGIVQRLMAEGYLETKEAPRGPQSFQPVL
ncbi:MAG TPA: hypothetical protein VFM12_02820, partial [Gemmatimonadales bacterium]|nr:hypothetical protein [Gemmatimonadales bacterium]